MPRNYQVLGAHTPLHNCRLGPCQVIMSTVDHDECSPEFSSQCLRRFLSAGKNDFLIQLANYSTKFGGRLPQIQRNIGKSFEYFCATYCNCAQALKSGTVFLGMPSGGGHNLPCVSIV